MNTLIATKPRLAFAGVGWIGRHRLQAAAESGLADIVVLTDPSAACTEAASQHAPQARIDAQFDAALAAGVDGVVIATPSALHMEQAVAAFGAGKAVFCQKPLGRNRAEVRAVVAAARRADRLLGADFSYRYTAAYKAVLEVVGSGELGTIFAAELKFHNAYGPDKPWFYDKARSGGGCVLDLGIHLVDLLLYTFGFPEVTTVSSRLYATGQPLQSADAVEDFAQVQLQLANGVAAQMACSWNLQAGREAEIELSLYGTKGGVALKNINGSFYDFAAYRYRGTRTEVLVSPPDAWGGKALLHWISALAHSNGFDASANNFIHAAAVLDRIYEGR